MKNIKVKNRTYMLRTCKADMTSCDGFKWPKRGWVYAPDWEATAKCGAGLHGALRGEGDGSLFNWAPDAIWQVCEIDADEIIDLGGKIKVPRAKVVFCGSRYDATRKIYDLCGPVACIGGTATAGDRSTATAGFSGTATAGNWGTATAGDWGTATAGDSGTATAGKWGTATAGKWGTATAGDRSTATAGDGGAATAGYRGTATAGDGGAATAGDYGTATAGESGAATAGDGGTATAGESGAATAGDGGTATAGYRGTAMAGDGGIIKIGYFDGDRYRIKIGYIGEMGLMPNAPYKLDANFNFIFGKRSLNNEKNG